MKCSYSISEIPPAPVLNQHTVDNINLIWPWPPPIISTR